MKTLRKYTLALLVVVISFVSAVTLSEQTTAQTQTSTPAAVVPKVELIKLPAERNTQLKQIAERQELLSKEFQALESQKVIVAQRAALELHLTAEQVDGMDLVFNGNDGYAFKPKDKPPAKIPEKP